MEYLERVENAISENKKSSDIISYVMPGMLVELNYIHESLNALINNYREPDFDICPPELNDSSFSADVDIFEKMCDSWRKYVESSHKVNCKHIQLKKLLRQVEEIESICRDLKEIES